MKEKNKDKTFTNDMLDEWKPGALMRLLRTATWAGKAIAEDIGGAYVRGVTQKKEVGWITKKGQGGLNEIRNQIIIQLRSRSALREVQGKVREIWPTNFTSGVLEHLELPALTQKPEIKKAFPKEIAEAGGGYPVVCFKYDIPLGVEISNEKRVILNAHKLQDRTCNCHQALANFKNEEGHVVTANLKILDNNTRKLLQKGTTFRGKYAAHDGDTMDLLKNSIANYIKQCSQLNEVNPSVFNEWREIMLEQIEKKLPEA